MIAQTSGRLAIFLPGLYDGGAERIMLNLAEGLARRGYGVDLVLAEAAGPYMAAVPPSVRLVVLNSHQLKTARTLASLPAFVRYLRRERPAALLSNLNYANIVALWAKRLAGLPIRVVVTEHNTFSVESRQLSPSYGWLLRQLVRSFYPWADNIVVVSKAAADDLSQATGLPRDRIDVIYNPIVTADLREKAEAPFDHPWFRPGQPPVVLGVGRLSPQKDFVTLIRAFAEVRGRTGSRGRASARLSARLVILGEGEDREALEALVAGLGLQADVDMPGFVPNPYAYMAHSKVFVLSSRWEGLPTVLVEALFCGAPVISTDCPSGPREILQDGQFGCLVPIGDVAALAQAIEGHLAGALLQRAEAARAPGTAPQESWQPFDTATAVDQYLNVLLDRGEQPPHVEPYDDGSQVGAYRRTLLRETGHGGRGN